MRSLRLSLLAALVATLAACGSPTVSGIKTDGPVENDAPLSDLATLFDGAPADSSLPPVSAFAALPAKYDVVALQSPIRNQRHRGTCSIFATVGLMEHLYVKEGTIAHPDFSEQYLQWSVKNQVGSYKNSEGSNPDANLRAINQYGIVAEEVAPYDANPWTEANDPECKALGEEESGLPTKCYTNGDPSADALAATKYKLPAGRWISTSGIKNYIKTNDQAAIVSLTFFYQAWNHRLSELPTNPDYWRNGFVTYPNADDKTKSFAKPAGHAVVLVGWDDNLEVPMRDATGTILTNADGTVQKEKGFFIFKNSWGTGNFGINNPYGDGYGFLSYKYISEFGSSYVAGMPTNVPLPPSVDAVQHGAATPALAIPDDVAAGVTSTISIPNAGAIKALTVAVDVTHTWKGDLRVTLTHGGRTVTLQDQAGGSADDLKTTFTVAGFATLEAKGDWTLTVSDMAAQDLGTLNAWSFDVTTGS